MSDLAIKVEDVSKTFRLPYEKNTSVKSAFINVFRTHKKGYQTQKALSSISLEIKKGDFFGIVGRNGSGKSTLLKLLAGIYTPTRGQVHVRGSLTPFIELGVGFNPELTGRENVFLNGALLGFNRKEMQSMYQEVVEFAELERFMDQKLKNYSSGMQVRLAFSIAIRAKSDILLIDEVLAVGDAAFQSKCFEYFRVLKQQGKTVVFVSHDRGAIENFCDRCILIDDGSIVASGAVNTVLKRYNEITLEHIALATSKNTDESKNRWGNQSVEITTAHTYKDGKKLNKYGPYDWIELVMVVKANKKVIAPIYGVTMSRQGESPVFVTNTKIEGVKTADLNINETARVSFKFENIFGNGVYVIAPAVANEDGTAFYDWREDLVKIHISGWGESYIAIHPKHQIKVTNG